jgi:acyl transferase domain-containing protein/phosphopantetheinyl transferase
MATSDIAIIGMACIFPAAPNLSRFWSNLVNGIDAVTTMPINRQISRRNGYRQDSREAVLHNLRGGFVPDSVWFDPLRYGVVPNTFRRGIRDQFMLMQLADEALQDAGVKPDAPVRRRTDIIVGHANYGNHLSLVMGLWGGGFRLLLNSLGEQFADLTPERLEEMDCHLRSAFPYEKDLLPTMLPNLIASRTANRLNLRGGAYVVDGACASSLIAVDEASRRLREGRCDLALAGGISLQNTETMNLSFIHIGALSRTGQIRPFDKRADGLVVGEGGGVVVLKRLDDAIDEGDRVYAVIRGIGVSSDGRSGDVMAPSISGQCAAYSIAYQEAGVDPASISYLEAHGTATSVGDRTELASIRSFFGAPSAPLYGRSMGSLKSMIGHLLPAAGMASLIKTALALSNKVIPPTLHCDDPCDEVADGPFHIASETRAWIQAPVRGPRRAAINAFGFGGINTHLILEEMTSVQTGSSAPSRCLSRAIDCPTAWPSELVVISGVRASDVIDRLERLRSFIQRDATSAGLADITAAVNAELVASHPCKLALVVSGIEELLELIDASVSWLASNATKPTDERLYYSDTAAEPAGKVACIIPGSSLPGLMGNLGEHLAELALHFPEIREEFDRLDAREGHGDDQLPLSVILNPPRSLPQDVLADLRARLTPLRSGRLPVEDNRPGERHLFLRGMMIANWLFWVMIRTFDIPFDMLAGQSIGECSALCAAGVISIKDYIKYLWDIAEIDYQYVPGQSLVIAQLTAEHFKELSADYDDVYIAIHTTPDLLVIGGASASIEQLVKQLYAEGVFAVPLPVPPLHTRCMSHLRAPHRAVLEALPEFGQPRLPVYMSSSVDLCANERAEIIELLCNSLDHPCYSWQSLNRMVDDGARVFVCAGQGALQGLPLRDDIVSVSIDLEVRDPLTQLNHFCAALLSAGVSLNLDLLVRHRLIRSLNLDEPQPAPEKPITAISYGVSWQSFNGGEHSLREMMTIPLANPEATAAVTPSPGLSSSSAEIKPGANVPIDSRTGSGTGHAELIQLDHNFPFVGPIEHFVPQQLLRYSLRLSLAEHQFIAHHRFLRADGIKPLSRLQATLPLTFSMELMAEAAALLSPGLGLIGFENVRASKWIQFAGCEMLDLNVEARVKVVDSETGVQRVDVSIQFNGAIAATGTVLYASEYCHDIGEGPTISSNDPPWPLTAQEAYTKGRLFHGPMFEGVARLDGYGNPSFSADLVVLPKDALFASRREPCFLIDPLLLDAMTQVVGLWWNVKEIYVLPVVVDSVEIHRPSLPVGTMIRLHGEMTEFDSHFCRIKANVDLDDGSGNLWMRVRGWTDTGTNLARVPQIGQFGRQPAETFVSHEIVLADPSLTTVCTMIQLPKSFSLDQIAVLLLHLEEEAEYKAIVDRSRRRDFVNSRFAVKDAIRLWWMRRGADPIHPATIHIDHDQNGRPFVSQEGMPVLPWISLAHSDGTAVAIASDQEIGIDLEPLSNCHVQLDGYASDMEKALLAGMASQAPDEAWDLRLWCAKEAAAKACGTGLQGRPRDFALVGGDPGGLFLIRYAATGASLQVHVLPVSQHLIAIARHRPGPSVAGL